MLKSILSSIAVRTDFLLGLVAAFLLFSMMLITTVDVIGRYVFNAPMRGAFELTELMLVVLIYAGLPLVSRNNEHIVVDVFDRWMSPAMRRALDVIAHLLAGLTLLGMTWLLVRKALRIVENGDVTSTLKVGLAPFAYLMSALVFATAIIHVSHAIFRPETREKDEEGGNVL